MPITSRRTFMAWLATLPPASVLARRSPALPGGTLDEVQLRAVIEAVLPMEIGRVGIDREVAAFRRWLAEYQPGAELVHGYGTATIRTTPVDPTVRWASQLKALDEESRTRSGGKAFDALDLQGRRRLIADALKDERSLPNVADARHIALAVLAHFYGLADAADLCYGAKIQRNACRPLAQSSVKP
jgi:hypothetical protein